MAIVRRHAATCLDLPGAGARSQDHADGRAVRRARRHDAREDECRTDADPARDRQDGVADHAFDSGSSFSGRPRAGLHRTGAADPKTLLHPKRAGLESNAMPPRIAVRDISFFERPIPFAKPFRFGSVVITSSVEVFVRAEIEIEGKGTSIG